jgi:regulator of replication initiation timing
MADDISLQIDNALNAIFTVTEKSGNLKKELRYEIHETISHLRKLVATLKNELTVKMDKNNKMSIEVKQFKDALDKKSTTPSRLVATSVNRNTALTSHGTVVSATQRNYTPKSSVANMKSGTSSH